MQHLPPINARADDEFSPGAAEWDEALDRRAFLRTMAASFALAGGVACTRQPLERLVPYVRQPEELLPGRPLQFATALTRDGYARGVLVESHEGRPTKIEGNPDHPASLGATEPWMQAAILDLYDPDRSPAPLRDGQIATWDAFLGELSMQAAKWQANGGAGLRILTSPTTSPTLLAQLESLRQKYPGARWCGEGPFPGLPEPRLDLSSAEIIVAFDCDFLSQGADCLRHAREFAALRRSASSKLHSIECSPTLTGSVADHRHLCSLGELEKRLRALESGDDPLTGEFQSHAGHCVIVAGAHLPEGFRARVRALNEKWGTPYLPSSIPPRGQPLEKLTEEMQSGRVETLLILGANPVYQAPADFNFAALLRRVPFAVHLGLYRDETGALCRWHLPAAHELETWADARAIDGSASLIQPLIEPLYGGRSPHELLAALAGEAPVSGYDLVQRHWREAWGAGDFDLRWKTALRQGLVAAEQEPAALAAPPAPASLSTSEREGLHLVLRPHPYLHDGAAANNGWLQELPQPFTKLTWGNAALISGETARRLQLTNGDEVDLRFRGRSLRAPVWILDGQPANHVTLHFGYGRTRSGRVGAGIGVNAYSLRTSAEPWGGPGLELVKTGQRRKLFPSQEIAVADWHAPEPGPSNSETLFPPVARGEYAWGMSIDLGACTGCSACVVACQAENNIPVVGAEQVARGRIMHWLRIDACEDRSALPPEAPRIVHQPVPCMHCENAPCEVVCPTAATVHNSDGLNQMIYNRCVGTRYCANNCPYKVRRFNFLAYTDAAPSLRLGRNPNVTVRSRGVMEKCTYCVQRIQAATVEAHRVNRSVEDGEIVPACAQACPTQAIVFGDTQNPAARVSQLKASPRNFALLPELNTRPRTTYLRPHERRG